MTRTWQVTRGSAWWVGHLTRTWPVARVKGRVWWVGQFTRTWRVASQGKSMVGRSVHKNMAGGLDHGENSMVGRLLEKNMTGD